MIDFSQFDSLFAMTMYFNNETVCRIDEVVYRWNTRKDSQSKRFTDMFTKSIGHVVPCSELKLCQVA
ncbi:hypothetical protein [Bacteroides sp.]